MRRPITAATALALTAAGAAVLAAPAGAAPPPRPQASCVGQTFAPQTMAYGPGAIADRIAEIKGFVDVSFGVVISDFARWPDCNPE